MNNRKLVLMLRTIAIVGVWAGATRAASTPGVVTPPVKNPTTRPATGKSPDEAACGHSLPASGQTAVVVAGDDGGTRAGTPLSYVDNGDGTITDRTTGLMWEKKVKLDNARDPANLHDADNCYPWVGRCATSGASCGTDADCGTNGSCTAADCQTAIPSGLTILKWVAQLNASKFAGHNDWRLPNPKELQSIVNYGVVNPAVTTAFNGASCGKCDNLANAACSCTQSNNYWTSTTYALPGVTDGAWAVHFANGAVVFNVKHATNFVRAVRGGM